MSCFAIYTCAVASKFVHAHSCMLGNSLKLNIGHKALAIESSCTCGNKHAQGVKDHLSQMVRVVLQRMCCVAFNSLMVASMMLRHDHMPFPLYCSSAQVKTVAGQLRQMYAVLSRCCSRHNNTWLCQ